MIHDQLYLRHILDSIERIQSYIVVGQDTFLSTPHWQDAGVDLLAVWQITQNDLPDLKRHIHSILGGSETAS